MKVLTYLLKRLSCYLTWNRFLRDFIEDRKSKSEFSAYWK